MNSDKERTDKARAKAITNLDNTLKEVLIIRNNMAKDIYGAMLVLKEATREEYDLSGQNPLYNFRDAVRELMKVEEEEERAGGVGEHEPLEFIEAGMPDDKPFTASLSSVEPFNVKQVKKALEHYCDGKGVPTGKRGVFKPFIPGFTRATTRSDLQYRIGNAYNLLYSQGVL